MSSKASKSSRQVELASERISKKKELVDALSGAVKELQLEFYRCGQSKIDQPTTPVLQLCNYLDWILRDGLVKAHQEHGFWKYAKLFTRKDVIKQIDTLRNVKTDIGRGRAWIRIALNEASMEPFIRMFLDDDKHKKKFYSTDAIVYDDEQGSLVTMILSGLEFLTFQIEYDVKLMDPMKKGGSIQFDRPDIPVKFAQPSVVKKPSSSPVFARRNVSELPMNGDAVDIAALVSTAAPDDGLLHTHTSTKKKKKKKKPHSKTSSTTPPLTTTATTTTTTDRMNTDTIVGDSSSSPTLTRTYPTATSDNLETFMDSVEETPSTSTKTNTPPPSQATSTTPTTTTTSPLTTTTLTPTTTTTITTTTTNDADSGHHGDDNIDTVSKKLSETWVDKLPKSAPKKFDSLMNEVTDGDDVNTDDGDDGDDGGLLQPARQTISDFMTPAGDVSIPPLHHTSNNTINDDTSAWHSNTDINNTNTNTNTNNNNNNNTNTNNNNTVNADPALIVGLQRLNVQPSTSTSTPTSRSTSTSTSTSTSIQGNTQPVMEEREPEPTQITTEPDTNTHRETHEESNAEIVDTTVGEVETSQEKPTDLDDSSKKKMQDGKGADIDLELDSNTLLMIKLQIFQDDNEELVKIMRVAMLRETFERSVHVMITNRNLYILTPSANDNSQGYAGNVAIPFHQIREMKHTHGGNGIRLLLQSSSGPGSCQLLTGDISISNAIYDSLTGAMMGAGFERLLPPDLDAPRWQQSIAQFAGAQEGRVKAEDVACWFGYRKVNKKLFEHEVVHTEVLELKEIGIFSQSWKPQYFALQGQRFMQFESVTAKSCKLMMRIDDQYFWCKKVADTEGKHCLEIGNQQATIIVACPTFDGAEIWFQSLQRKIVPCVIGNVDYFPSTHGYWVPALIVQTPSNFYMCHGRRLLSKGKLELVGSFSIEAITSITAPDPLHGTCSIEFDTDQVDHASPYDLLFKSRYAMQTFTDAIRRNWKDLYRVDLQTNGF